MLLKNIKSHKDSYLSWLVCIGGALFFFYDFIQLMMCNTLSSHLMRDFHIDVSKLSYLSSAFLLANTLLLFPAGILINRYSTRNITIGMLGLSVLGAFGFAFTDSFRWACTFRFLAGIAHAFCFLCCTSLISRWFSEKRQAFVIGIVVMIAMLGGTVAQKPLDMLTSYVGWRFALQVNAFLGALILLFVVLIVQDYPSTAAAENEAYEEIYSQMPFLKTLIKTLGNVQNWFYGLYTALLNLPIMLLGALWGNLFLPKVHAVTSAEAATAASFLYIGTLIGSPLVGKWSDLWGKRKAPMWIGGILSLLVLIPVLYSKGLSPMTLTVLFFALGLVSSTQVISYPCIGALNDKALGSTAMGLAATIIMGLGGASQPITGMLIKWHARGASEYTAQDFTFALSIMTIGIIIALGSLLIVKEPPMEKA